MGSVLLRKHWDDNHRLLQLGPQLVHELLPFLHEIISVSRLLVQKLLRLARIRVVKPSKRVPGRRSLTSHRHKKEVSVCLYLYELKGDFAEASGAAGEL